MFEDLALVRLYLTFTFSSGFVVLETVVEGFVDVVTVVDDVVGGITISFA